jgi:acetylornithine/succinyldiaminopimelate/putrescine aminotransferase
MVKSGNWAVELQVLADERLHAQASEKGERFQQRVRGRGLLLAVELKEPATPVIRAMREHGVCWCFRPAAP